MSYKIKSNVIFSLNEKEIVDTLSHVLTTQFKDRTLAGFNVSFDLHNTQLKMLKHNCMATPVFPNKTWEAIDIRDMLTFGNKFQTGTLEDFLKLFSLENKYKGYTGEDVHQLYLDKKYEEIREYSRKDAEVELKLFLKVNSFKKKPFNPMDILVFDIETVFDDSAIEDKDILIAKKLEELKIKYKTDGTIKKHLAEYEKSIDSKEYLKKYALDPFKNKIISISYAWAEYDM